MQHFPPPCSLRILNLLSTNLQRCALAPRGRGTVFCSSPCAFHLGISPGLVSPAPVPQSSAHEPHIFTGSLQGDVQPSPQTQEVQNSAHQIPPQIGSLYNQVVSNIYASEWRDVFNVSLAFCLPPLRSTLRGTPEVTILTPVLCEQAPASLTDSSPSPPPAGLSAVASLIA